MNQETAKPLLHMSASPYIRDKRSVRSIMLWTLGALVPAIIAGYVLFGWQAGIVVIITIAFALGTEALISLLITRTPAIPDGSAAITGAILGLSLPPHVPVWIAALGAVFAIGVIKMPMGGLGRNFLNPAMAARAMLMLSFPAAMSAYASPLFGTMNGIDAMSSATPLAAITSTLAGDLFQPLDFQGSLVDLFLGKVGGSIGGTSAAAILIGAIILMYRRIITLTIPVLFIGTVFTLSWLFNPTGAFFTADALIVPTYQILCGGLIMTAFFVASDPVTSPVSPIGRIIFAIGCGILTWGFRTLGPGAEGVTFAILIMNCLVPLIDRFSGPRPVGGAGAIQQNTSGV